MIAILAYHSLDRSTSVLSISPGIFAQQMKFLHDAQIKVICLSDVPHEIGTYSHPANSVVITNVPPYSLVLGNPAEVYFKNFGRPAKKKSTPVSQAVDG